MKRPTANIKSNSHRIERDLVNLSKIVSPDDAGYTRISFSDHDVAAREYLRHLMQNEAGLKVRTDAAGNLIGRKNGRIEKPAILTGSHCDTVRAGGMFDGLAGVVAGIEAARQFREKGIGLIHPLEIIVFTAEEPSPFGISTIGSRGMVGKLPLELLETLRDNRGRTLAAALEGIGGDPSRFLEANKLPADVHAFLELHIEQGPLLFATDTPIGVVTGISSIWRRSLEIIGRNDHAGTVPMQDRRDALTAAAEAVLVLEKICRGMDDVVGTVGMLNVFPNSTNVVPGTVTLEMEVRSLNSSRAHEALSLLEKALQQIEKERDLRISIKKGIGSEAVFFDQKMVGRLRKVCERLHIPCREMASGAGHDASHMAELAPAGMIFIPSRDGRSHCPEEWSDFDHIALGTDVLAETILLIDKEENL